MKRWPLTIFEGGIGVGKSTLVRELAKYIGPAALPLMEPVPEDGTNNLLSAFYKDMKRWSFTFQISQLSARMELQLLGQYWAMSGKGPALCDRSFYGDTCFARMLNKSGMMSNEEFSIYKNLYQTMTAFVLRPSICVRLMASPEVQIERIKSRLISTPERYVESTIDIGYLRSLEEEISKMTQVLKEQGTEVLDVLYDVELSSEKDRRQIVRNLADRLSSWVPKDDLLDLHRRISL